ncbi:MAG TPA: hypothetical protein VEJ84_12295 [Acidimicrobiales bacterium]|nr:hypothetical protein [Acidimicrobiales bacterium]
MSVADGVFQGRPVATVPAEWAKGAAETVKVFAGMKNLALARSRLKSGRVAVGAGTTSPENRRFSGRSSSPEGKRGEPETAVGPAAPVTSASCIT